MEIQALSFIICEKILRDIINPNKLSFIGVFGGFTTRILPFPCPPMFLAVQYGLGQGECRHHFEIQDSSGQVLFKSPDKDFFLDNRTASHTDIAGVEGILFTHPGLFWAKSFLNGEIKSQIPIQITYQPHELIQTVQEDPQGKTPEN